MLAGDINIIIIIMGSPNLYIFVGGNKGNKQYFGDGFFSIQVIRHLNTWDWEIQPYSTSRLFPLTKLSFPRNFKCCIY